MDKHEYRVKTEKMLEYMSQKSYKEAMNIADMIDWRKVKNVSMLSAVSEIYEANQEYQQSRDVLFLAYDRSPDSKKIIYRLGTLALKMGDTKEAADCYEEFVALAPKDPNRFILQYKILKSKNAPLGEQIEILEEFKKVEYVEKWAFELAKLYREAGMISECIEECDDLILWFNEGKYVYNAMELKMQYKTLTPLQQEKYNLRFMKTKPEEETVLEEPVQTKQGEEVKAEDIVEEKKETPTLSIEEMLQDWESKQKENAEMIRAEVEKAEQEKAEMEKDQEESAEEVQEDEEILSDDIRQLMEALETESADIEAQKIKQDDEPEVPQEEKPLIQKVAEQLAAMDIKEAITSAIPVAPIPTATPTEPQVPVHAEMQETIEEEKEVEVIEEAKEEVSVSEQIQAPVEEAEGLKLGDTQSMAAVAKALKNNVEIEIPEEEEETIHPEEDRTPYDTGFIVKGRYDLEAQSEIGLKAGLTEEQKKLFSYFVPVHGMSEQLVEVLEEDRKCKSRYGTSRIGNLVIIGRKGSGKTVLAVDVVKAIQKSRRLKQGKVGIVTAESLNKKDVAGIMEKLHSGALIVEKASRLNRRTVETMCEIMEGQTGELLVVLEDERKPMERLMEAFPQFAKKFTSRLEVPVFINDELVTFGQTYAKENGYKIDEMGILALYSRIDILQRDEKVVTVADVKEILDDAIENSQRASFKKLVKKFIGKDTDESDRILLREEDFK